MVKPTNAGVRLCGHRYGLEMRMGKLGRHAFFVSRDSDRDAAEAPGARVRRGLSMYVQASSRSRGSATAT